MKKKGTKLAIIFALLFVPGAIPAFIVTLGAKKKKKAAQKKNEG